MNSPKVSVIMSTYNTKREYLIEAINSILEQSFEDFEFIIVCDGSEKDIEIIKEYSDSRIKIIINDKNQGLPYSLNKAIKMSKGEYIARMDSDDIAIPNRLEKQVKFLDKNKDIDICSMFYKKIGNEKKVDTIPYIKNNLIKINLLFYNVLVHPLIMIRKKFLLDNKLLYNEEFLYSQDFELWSRCAKVGSVEIIPNIGLYYRMHPKQISTDKKEKQFEYYKEVLEENLKEFEDLNIEKIDIENIIILFSANNKIDKEKIIEISNLIDKLISKNKKYKQSDLETILYYKFFNKVIKSKFIIFNISLIIKNKELRKKIFRFSNFKLNIKNIYYKIKCIL